MLIGLISDTHGLLRAEALEALQGVDHIIHAGDIGTPQVLQQLQALAPLSAIRGNNDYQPWASDIPDALTVELDGVAIHVIHDVNDLKRNWPAAQIVVSGHSHKPSIAMHDGILFVNPGSAGPRRFTLPVAIALLRTNGPDEPARAEIRHLL